MSVVGLASSDQMFKKSLHRKNDSGELDVFEAAKYFSVGGNHEIYGYTNMNSSCGGRDHHHPYQEKRRLSLDVAPIIRNAISKQTAVLVMDHQLKKQQTNAKENNNKKHKQPSSPGGRLASFLNSLFNQKSISSKKKKKSCNIKDDELIDDESPPAVAAGWRRKRRSSISHFRSTATTTITADAKSLYSSSGSGFRTPPPPYTTTTTPTKAYKDLNKLHVMANLISSKPTTTDNIINDVSDYAWLDEKLGFTENNYQNKQSRNNINALLIPDKKIQQSINWVADRGDEKEFKKFNEDEDGADTDSSSDLFELPNYDLGCFSSGLPVYETTNVDSIKRTPPISTSTR